MKFISSNNSLSLQCLTTLILLIGFLFFSSSTRAQTTVYPVENLLNSSDLLSLYEESPISAASNATILTDVTRRMTTRDVLDRFFNKQNHQKPAQRSLIKGDHYSAPIWIALPVINRSETENWQIDFGDRLKGRSVFFKGVFLYDHATRKLLVNNLPDRSGQIKTDAKLKGTGIKITLPRLKPTLLLVYLIPDNTNPPIFPLYLIPATKEISNDSSLLQSFSFHMGLLSILAGFFSAIAFLTQRISLILIAIYILLSLGTILPYQETAFLSSFPAASTLPHIFLLLQGATLTLLAWLLYRDSILGFLPSFLLLGGTAAQGSMIAVLIFTPFIIDGNFSLILLSAVLGPFLVLAVSLIHTRQGDLVAFYMLLLCILKIVAESTNLGLSSLLQSNITPTLVNLGFYSIYLQSLIFGTLLRTLQLSISSNSINETSRTSQKLSDAARLSKIHAVKEGYDYNSLVKVIEHERRSLAEARERESLRTDEMRRAKEAADDANRAKSAFLAVISHEIRTPMTGVMGMVRMLLDSTLTKEQREYALTIRESGDAMMSLLNDILDFEKMDTGRMQLEAITFNLHRMVTSIITLMQGHANGKGIILTLELDPETPHYVVGDMTRLRQVLLNLVGNAIKFTQNGSVTLRINSTPPEEMAIRKPGHHQLYFGIQDTGIGISQDAQKNIFTPFAQADKSITRKYGGTGLGLAISQKIVQAMGGEININSKEGKGSTFFFSLLLPEGHEENAAADQGSQQAKAHKEPVSETEQKGPRTEEPHKQLNVLVVEDNEVTQRVIQALLDQKGHKVTQAFSGYDALTLLQKEGASFDFIFSDVQMPGISGHEFTRAVRTLPQQVLANIPIIALTGHVDESDIMQCYEAGMNDHLAKPIDPDAFNDIMNRAQKKSFRNTVVVTAPIVPARPDEPEKPLAISHPKETDPTQTPTLDSSDNAAENFSEEDLQDSKTQPSDERAPIFNLLEKMVDPSIKNKERIIPPPPPIEAPPVLQPETKESGPDESIFDMDMLQTLKDSLGIEQLSDILSGFFNKTEELISALSEMKPPYVLEDVRARAHEMKGMTGNFGLMALSRAAQKIENAAKGGETESLGTLIKELPQTYAQGRFVLDEWLKS